MKKSILSMAGALAVCSTLAVSVAAFAGTIRVSSNEKTQKAELLTVAQDTLGLLTDAGVRLVDRGNGLFEARLRNFHCDGYHRGALDTTQALSGIPTSRCRMRSENKKDTIKGRIFADGRAMQEIFGKLEAASSNVFFTDCGMGYCGTFAKSVTCTVDTKIESYVEGRYHCEFTDGN